ncbi:MAG: M15 family metallopeptidase [Spirochaetes bacterium]|nr:M15 family metallopeptidase [Spirochaetota bacterium]
MAFALFLALLLVFSAPGSPLASLVPTFAARPAAPALPGEAEVRALAETWPGRIAEAAVRDGEWMLRVDDTWFAWANGRLLPEAERGRWEEFVSLSFYRYPLKLPPLAVVDEETSARLRERVRENERNPPQRNDAFLGLLLRAASRAETEARIMKMEVAGYTVSVHEDIAGPLALVSDELRALKASNPEVAAFLRGLVEMNGYNYRFVDSTRTRSYHSYGLAVDLIPRSYGGRHPYWRWAIEKESDWWAVPYARRWMVPTPVVEAFERHGFVWGGKWLFFDTMHFEYRPEVLRLARNAAAEAAAAAAVGEGPGPDS